MHDLMKVIKAVDNNRGLGFFYWEPTWINIGKAYWSKEPGIRYLNKEVSLANVWYNLALFDYKGNALPALEVIRFLMPDDSKVRTAGHRYSLDMPELLEKN